MDFLQRRRGAVVLTTLCILLALSDRPNSASAINQVIPANPDGGFTTCNNCFTTQNQATKSGTTTSGNASNTDYGQSLINEFFDVPSSQSDYYGQYLVQVTDATGTLIYQATGNTAQSGGAGSSAFGWNLGPPVPTGGSISLNLNFANANGSSFTAGYLVQNFK